MTKRFVITEDGSHTLFLSELNEHYHSVHGAVSESVHVFIEAGLKPKMPGCDSLNVLEIGLGTGLNAALTLLAAEESRIQIGYYAVEPNPLQPEDILKLNFYQTVGGSRMKEVIPAIHAADREVGVRIGSCFDFHYFEKRIQEAELKDNFFDVVYFDAFSPGVQPEMWTAEVFQKIFNSMKQGGVLVTYVAKGEVRRTMKACGFTIEKLPGFASKREMTRANKK